jgi:light-regulated signal transduction histidine kinase (bacteriophytochrome)
MQARRPSRALTLPARDGWLDALLLLAGEVLKRQDAVARARRAEQAAEMARTHATMGRYMIEMRHAFNNALTSVLGNSELLLLEPGALSAEVREQIATIHSMSMRMNEILQRFSSMEAEMRAAHKLQPEARDANSLYAAAAS